MYLAVGGPGAVVGVAVKLVPGDRSFRGCCRINIVSFIEPVVCQFLKVLEVNGTVAVEIGIRPVLLKASGWIQPDIIEEYGADTKAR